MPSLKLAPYLVLLTLSLSAISVRALGEENAPDKKAVKSEPAGEEIEEDKIKEAYWGQGEKNQISVIQERLYSKSHKVEIALLGGIDIGDPFLSTYIYGGSVGYHFSELFSVHGIFWNASVGPSRALTALQTDTGTTANTNEPRHYFGLEARASLLYGKLSVVGRQIIHFNTYLSGGVGSMSTESGSNLGLTVGIGQQFNVSRQFAVNIAYQFMGYGETVIEKQAGQTTPIGQALGNRTNLSNLITLGFSVFFGPVGEEKDGALPSVPAEPAS